MEKKKKNLCMGVLKEKNVLVFAKKIWTLQKKKKKKKPIWVKPNQNWKRLYIAETPKKKKEKRPD